MRTRDDIQRAHDVLHEALFKHPKLFKTNTTRQRVMAALGALCWILGHEGGEAFGQRLSAVEEEFERTGFKLLRANRPFVGDPPQGGVP